MIKGEAERRHGEEAVERLSVEPPSCTRSGSLSLPFSTRLAPTFFFPLSPKSWPIRFSDYLIVAVYDNTFNLASFSRKAINYYRLSSSREDYMPHLSPFPGATGRIERFPPGKKPYGL
ncbi:unnamed protein product [Protopolystoma xenopodis]|uniref:Uncharacterized protein n=1 Tax=Protopolystoma xenopodis TaxID=117903 RepID=A0A448WP75_9PLAT|nr:unnamed protein product [Protopolystoma xenopodis]